MNPGIIMNRPYILCDTLFSMIMVLDFTGTSTLYYITLLKPERVFQHPDHRFTKVGAVTLLVRQFSFLAMYHIAQNIIYKSDQ